LQNLPYADLQRGCQAALRKANPPPAAIPDVRRIGRNLGFAPVMDGRVVSTDAFNPAAPAVSADVPMIIGTTLNEFINGINLPDFEQLTEARLLANVEAGYPGRSKAIIDVFRANAPHELPCDIWSRISTAPVRQAAVSQAASKAVQGVAPAWLYLFSWATPVFDGRPRAFHCAELPFVFYNWDRCDSMTGGGPDAQALAERIANAWIQFARTGDPNHSALPAWDPYTPDKVPTMIFDNDTRLVLDLDSNELASIAGTD